MRKLIFVFAIASIMAACGDSKPAGETLEDKIARLEQKGADTSLTERERLTQLSAAYLAYVDSLPQSDTAPHFLYKAAYNTGVLGDYTGAINLYERFLKQYKNSPKCPEVLWAMGATYENNLQNFGMAASTYQRIMDEYPDHKLAKDAENAKRFVGREPTAEEIEEIMRQAEGGNTDTATVQ